MSYILSGRSASPVNRHSSHSVFQNKVISSRGVRHIQACLSGLTVPISQVRKRTTSAKTYKADDITVS
jgi:hypothetical protein